MSTKKSFRKAFLSLAGSKSSEKVSPQPERAVTPPIDDADDMFGDMASLMVDDGKSDWENLCEAASSGGSQATCVACITYLDIPEEVQGLVQTADDVQTGTKHRKGLFGRKRKNTTEESPPDLAQIGNKPTLFSNRATQALLLLQERHDALVKSTQPNWLLYLFRSMQEEFVDPRWRVAHRVRIPNADQASGGHLGFDVTSMQKMDNVAQAFCISTANIKSPNTLKAKATAASLAEFCSTYLVDPYSALVGMTPKPSAMQEILGFKMASPLAVNATPGSLVVIRTPEGDKSSQLLDEWLIPTEPFEYLFARMVRTLPSKVMVTTSITDPDAHSVAVSPSDCYDLPPELLERIADVGTDLPALEKLIQSPLVTLSRKLLRMLPMRLFEFFASKKGLDVSIMNRVQKGESILSDTMELLRIRTMIRKDTEGVLVQEFFEEATEASQQYTTDFLTALPQERLFQPTLVEGLASLKVVFSKEVVAMTIASTQKRIAESLDALKVKRKAMVTGKSKDQLTEWWLSLIDSKMLTFIVDSGFVKDCVPEDYCVLRPENMNHVRRNLSLLEEILDDSSVFHPRLVALIEDLKNTIYPEIDAFIHDSLSVVAGHLDVDVATVVQNAKAAFEVKKADLDEAIQEWVADTIEDVEYLSEMKKLEDLEYAKGASVLAIVPVSGLAVSVLRRLENEHKTVIDFWEEEEGGDASSLLLHRELLAGALDPSLLDEKLLGVDINEQDHHLNTLLVVAADEGQYKVCKKLLEAKCDALIANQVGNTALHAVAKRRETEEDAVAAQVKCIKRLAKVIPVDVQNKAGETAVHLACFSDNPAVVKALLHLQANCDIRTKRDETPLFYAVRSNAVAVAKLLTDHGADLATTSKDNETALGLAMKYESTELINVLKEEYLHRRSKE